MPRAYAETLKAARPRADTGRMSGSRESVSRESSAEKISPTLVLRSPRLSSMLRHHPWFTGAYHLGLKAAMVWYGPFGLGCPTWWGHLKADFNEIRTEFLLGGSLGFWRVQAGAELREESEALNESAPGTLLASRLKN